MNEAIQYKTYCIEDIPSAEDRTRIMAEAVSNIDAKVLSSNSRFNDLKNIKEIKLLGYMSIYEEGDLWELVIAKFLFENNIDKHSLIPLSHGSYNPNLLNNIYFGLKTKSAMYGERKRLCYDGFFDSDLHRKIDELFSMRRPYGYEFYTSIEDFGIGYINFSLLKKSSEPLVYKKPSVELLMNKDIIIKYGSFSIYFPRFFSTVKDAQFDLQQADGYISYRVDSEEYLIGYLSYARKP